MCKSLKDMKSNPALIWIFQVSLFYFSMTGTKAQTNDNSKEIPCQSTEINLGRLEAGSWHCIINNENEFRKIVGGKTKIDFSKYSLIGVVYSSGGCKQPTVIHSIYFLEKSNSYRYELNIQENGNCEPLFHGNIWCLIPKISNETKVDFVKNFSAKP